jgi:hypothetical protein
MGFAGLYAVWQDKRTGKEIRSYTIITTTPNEMVGQYHDRMPVILEQELEDDRLNPDIVETERLLQMLKPYPSEKMETWAVGEAARNPRNERASLPPWQSPRYSLFLPLPSPCQSRHGHHHGNLTLSPLRTCQPTAQPRHGTGLHPPSADLKPLHLLFSQQEPLCHVSRGKTGETDSGKRYSRHHARRERALFF